MSYTTIEINVFSTDDFTLQFHVQKEYLYISELERQVKMTKMYFSKSRYLQVLEKSLLPNIKK